MIAFLLSAVPVAAVDATTSSVAEVVVAQSADTGEVTASGRIVPRRRSGIAPQVGGRIVRFGADAEGTPLDVGMEVREGETLFAVDAAPYELRLRAAEAGLASARASLADLVAPARKERLAVLRSAVTELTARLENQGREVRRFARLDAARATAKVEYENVQLEATRIRAQLDAAQAQLDEALAGPTATAIAVVEARVREAEVALASARKDMADTETKAPFDGRIVARARGVGDQVAAGPGGEVLTLISTAELEADLSLPESYLHRLSPGRTAVRLCGPALAGEMPLTVARIVPEVDARLGTFAFRVVIPADRCGQLVAGSFVTAVVLPDDGEGAVILPLSAVTRDAEGECVYVPGEGGVCRRAVRLGDRLTEGVLVTAGLRAGERVVLAADAARREIGTTASPGAGGKTKTL